MFDPMSTASRNASKYSTSSCHPYGATLLAVGSITGASNLPESPVPMRSTAMHRASGASRVITPRQRYDDPIPPWTKTSGFPDPVSDIRDWLSEGFDSRLLDGLRTRSRLLLAPHAIEDPGGHQGNLADGVAVSPEEPTNRTEDGCCPTPGGLLLSLLGSPPRWPRSTQWVDGTTWRIGCDAADTGWAWRGRRESRGACDSGEPGRCPRSFRDCVLSLEE